MTESNRSMPDPWAAVPVVAETPKRTTVTLSTTGDGTIQMHRCCNGTWNETQDDLRAFLESLQKELTDAERCPARPKQ